ncbi:sodium-dependent transporter [bacterium]|nr:sodium-dependent transporter [bacterium]
MENRPSWTSRYAFILAAIGSAVGLGNVWRFPYIMGQHGGAIFLITYLILITTICFIALMAELAVGKITKKECVGAYEEVSPKLKLFGALNPLTGIFVASFYFVVGGWILRYIYLSFTGFKAENYSQFFASFIQEPISNCVLSLVFLAICVIFTILGVKKGIEAGNKVMMPLLGFIVVGLMVFSLNLPNANLGLEYIFKPDFSKISSQMFLNALGQALFTLSIGMGALLTYGSYIKEDKNIVKSAYTIIFFDTLFALSAGIIIFPAIFSFGLEPNSGAGLVFVTLPHIFSQIPYNEIISGAFFILLFFAALTSGISILEVPVASLIERAKMTRIKANVLVSISVAILSIFASLSFGLLNNFKICGKTIFDSLDFLTANILMPINAIIICLIAAWGLKIKGEMFIQNKIMAKIFDIGLKFVVPIALLGVLIVGLV